MPKPKVFEKRCEIVDLKPGTYFWCACGESKNQPFCDGAHSSTSFSPVKFEITEERMCKLCLCKQTQKAPFCDGTHGML